MIKAVDGGLVVRSSVTVRLAPEAAFRLFTDGIGEWWPLKGHSVFDDAAGTVIIEPRAGGHVIERAADGRECAWGTVTEWDPGRRFAMTWYPGMDSSLATLLDIRFTDAPGGGTQVDLVHVGWEARGAEARGRAEGYQQGWSTVLAHFVEAAGD